MQDFENALAAPVTPADIIADHRRDQRVQQLLAGQIPT